MTQAYRRTSADHDLLAEGDEALVLVGESLLRIGLLAHEIVLAASDGDTVTVADLVDHCLAVFGPVPEGDAATVVEEAVRELVDAGVLEAVA